MLLCSGLVPADPLQVPEAFMLREGDKPSISGDGDWVAYQNGTLAQILPLGTLAQEMGGRDATAMLCGTLPAHRH